MDIKIEYIYHSAYKVELEDIIFVFDYFKSKLDLPKGKKIYFLTSHSHPDHFSEKIYDFPNVNKYILSDDIQDKNYPNTVFVSKDKTYDFGDFKLRTFGSTDEGLSFLVSVARKNIFHAGDLNDWYWEMEDDEKQRIFMHNWFLKEINKIKEYNIDIAFFLVDPRQASSYDLGGKQVIEILKPKHFFPMHFWNKYHITEKFKNEYQNKYQNTIIHSVEEKNQVFNLEI